MLCSLGNLFRQLTFHYNYTRKGIIEDLATKPGLIHLDAGLEYENQYMIEVINS